MAFGSAGASKAAFATRAIALLAAAAARAGARTARQVFGPDARRHIPAGRGRAHTWHLIRAAALAAAKPAGAIRLATGLGSLRSDVVHRPTVVVLSDFRDADPEEDSPGAGSLRAALLDLARRCDLIAVAITDPLDESLPDAGGVYLRDPESDGEPWLLDTGSRRVRERYRRAFDDWRDRVHRRLRSSGAEVLWLRSDRDPLFGLGRFFEERAKRRHRVTA